MEQNKEEIALYELRLALYDMIRVTKGVINNRGTILSARKRIEAAEEILKKHFKITDVLRSEQIAQAGNYAALRAKVESFKSALNEAKDTINWMWKHMKEADGQTLLQVDVFNRPANALHIIDSVIEQEGEKEPVPQQGPVWVKGAPKEMKVHYAVVPSKLHEGLTYKGVVIPMGKRGQWWAVGDGFAFDLTSEEIIEHLDESGREVSNG